MKTALKKICNQIGTNKFLKNVTWIFVGNLAHSILNFLLNILLARKFSPNDYGMISYATSLITLFLSIGTLGYSQTITKNFADDESKSGEYLGSTILARVIFACASILILQGIMCIFYAEDTLLRWIVFFQSLMLVFKGFEMYIFWFRYKDKADVVAILRLVAFGISALWRIVVLVTTANVIAYVIGTVLEAAIFAALLTVQYKKSGCMKLTFSVRTMKQLLKKSYPFIFQSILVTIYGQTDKIMLKSMLDNSAVALYSVSITLAGALAMIPTTLTEGFTPEIMKARTYSIELYQKRLKQLYAIVFWLSVAYCTFVTVFAKEIIWIVYGEKYIGAVPALSLVVWYSSFSYFGVINSLYMVAENKTVWVQILTLCGAVTNVVLNYFLIPVWGIVGAALASFITQLVTNFLLLAVIKPLRENFKIIISGIMLKGIR